MDDKIFKFTETELKELLMRAWVSGWLDYSSQSSAGVSPITDVNKRIYADNIIGILKEHESAKIRKL